MSGLIFRLPGFFTDPSIPKLFRDKVITAGTKFCYDSNDVYSYPKQLPPIAGVDVWRNLVESGPSATFAGSFGFGKGFQLAASGNRSIALPASGKPGATDAAMLVIIWIKLGDPGAGGSAVLNSGYDYGPGNQYAMTWSAGSLRYNLGGWQVTAVQAAAVVSTEIVQFAMSMKKRASDGKYDLVVYKNGVAQGTSISSFTAIPQPPAAPWLNPSIGSGPVYASTGWTGTVYRTMFDNCSVKSAAELVALDYAENHLRIAGV